MRRAIKVTRGGGGGGGRERGGTGVLISFLPYPLTSDYAPLSRGSRGGGGLINLREGFVLGKKHGQDGGGPTAVKEISIAMG